MVFFSTLLFFFSFFSDDLNDDETNFLSNSTQKMWQTSFNDEGEETEDEWSKIKGWMGLSGVEKVTALGTDIGKCRKQTVARISSCETGHHRIKPRTTRYYKYKSRVENS